MDYYLGIVSYVLKCAGDNEINSAITQLVKASTKEKARDAMVKDFKEQLPEAIILEARIHDTIIGE